MYFEAPTAEELSAPGSVYKVSDFPEPEVEVWDENWDVLHLFRQYSTQWRSSAAGPTGLDYNVIHHALDRKGLQGDDYDDFLADMRVIESVALRIIYK